MPTIHDVFNMTPEAVVDHVAGSADGIEVALGLIPMLVAQRRQRLIGQFVEQFGLTVQGGVFHGMILPEETAWADGDVLAKLLGAYEAELHGALETAFQREHALVINFGCAEGYYAVGAALRQPRAHVYAYDISEDACRVCAAAAARNGVGGRVTVSSDSAAGEIAALLTPETAALVILDCEGDERELLRPGLSALVRSSDLIIECHDFLDRGMSRRLQAQFAATHAVEMIREGARPPLTHPFLEDSSSFDRAIALCEFRPETMTWLFCASTDAAIAPKREESCHETSRSVRW